MLHSFTDDAVFHRINFPHDTPPSLRFHELKKRAILLSLGDDPSSRTTKVDVKLFKVALFYTDTDGDKGMITSDSDVPSEDQCDHDGVVKIFASVEKSHFIIKLALVGSEGKKVDCSASLKRGGRRIVSTTPSRYLLVYRAMSPVHLIEIRFDATITTNVLTFLLYYIPFQMILPSVASVSP